MNRVILGGRLTKDPEGDKAARYTLAVDGYEDHTDFISCVCFGSTADWVRKYLKKGTKVYVEGRIQTGSYENREGKKVYTTDVVVDRHEFGESKAKAETPEGNKTEATEIPESFQETLPFK